MWRRLSWHEPRCPGRFAVGVSSDNGVRDAAADAHPLSLVGGGFALAKGWFCREHCGGRRKNEEWAPASPHANPNHDLPR